MKIYVASSWRNNYQPEVVEALRAAGHEVYDFRNPGPGNTGFGWSQIDPAWQAWTMESYIAALEHPLAVSGFNSDFEAMQWADAGVLVGPAGRSAHLELGWMCGDGKPTAILLADSEPELMVKMCDRLCPTLESLVEWANAEGFLK